MNLVTGGAIVAAVMTGWGYIKELLGKVRSLFVVNVVVDDWALSRGIRLYCWQNLKRVPVGDRLYGALHSFVRRVNRSIFIGVEELGREYMIFYKEWWRIMIVRAQVSAPVPGGSVDSGSSSSSLSLTFIRGMWSSDEIVEAAVALLNDFSQRGVKEKRFFVKRLYGRLFLIESKQDGHMPDIASSDAVADPTELGMKRLINWTLEELGQGTEDAISPFQHLAFPDSVYDLVRELKRWKDSEKWYKSKSIPWKHGWLIHGASGTGKTALARAAAELLDLPVFSFDLASFTDECLHKEWQRLKCQVPCVALIEDIDAVFHGRENVVKGGDLSALLSFDCLLNVMDGIENSDGVFTIITTNHVELVDPALASVRDGKVSVRPGRINKAIELVNIDQACRIRLAERILDDCPQHIDSVVDYGDGMTPAQFQYTCEQVALKEHWEGREEELDLSEVLKCAREVPSKPEKKVLRATRTEDTDACEEEADYECERAVAG